ncbi:MAG: UDP-N-acetylglucosamine 1-carboxyvinyltransferase [Chloroflexi bacterium]|nr:UDP-N-acetylglucosamine 1-carboxyvinyltransferase [Chloroflexota bacterium]
MGKIVIEGGKRLNGKVAISGAKNAALPLMAATLLTGESCVLRNVPLIEDTYGMAEILRGFGAEVEVDNASHLVRVSMPAINSVAMPLELGRRMRASFLVSGPLLSRFGAMRLPHPGGCALGTRPVNVDVLGFQAMGAEVIMDGEYYSARASRLLGTRIYLDYPSHTGTENLLMAACLAKGKTVITHASTEPEVVSLAACLNSMGARVTGAGSSVIEVEGVDELGGFDFEVVPDRMEAGTFAIAAAITDGEVQIESVVPVDMVPVSHKLRQGGVELEEGPDWVRVRGRGYVSAVDVQALPFPGFPTDLQAAFGALMTQAHGVSTIFERVYDNRLLYTHELRKMGAQIEVHGQKAKITGPSKLIGTVVRALDIRCGAALVLAGLAADGVTEINDAYHVDRGYEDLVGRLAALGARIDYRPE